MTSRSTCRLSMMVALAAALRATAGFGSMMAVAAGESRPINPRFLTATDNFSTSHRGLLQRTRRHAYAEDATVMYARRDKTYLERSSEAEDDCDDGPILAVRALLQVRGGGGTGIGSGLSRLSEYIAASRSRSWTVLFLSILTDTVATTLMKTARKESSTPKLVVAFCGYFISLSGLALALKSIDVSIAYACWGALGTAIVSVAGIVLFGERFDAAKIICLSMIILGVVGLNLTEDH